LGINSQNDYWALEKLLILLPWASELVMFVNSLALKQIRFIYEKCQPVNAYIYKEAS